MPNAKRVAIYDILRGFMLINMILYHLLYDIVYILGYSIPWYHSDGAYLWQEIIVFTFVGISGACSYYSRNNFKRGAVILFWAFTVTLITSFLGDEYIVVFGVLHCLGLCMMIFPFVKPILDRIPAKVGIFAFVFLYLILSPIQDYNFSVNLFPLGIRTENFMSSDYIPLIPYIFVFLAGGLSAKIKMPEWTYEFHIPILEYLGKHSLFVYLLHQPIIYLLIMGFK